MPASLCPHLPAEPPIGLALGEPPSHAPCPLGIAGTSSVTSIDQLTSPLEGPWREAGPHAARKTPPGPALPMPAAAAQETESRLPVQAGLSLAVGSPHEPPHATNTSLSQQALGGPPTTSPPWDRPPQSFPGRWTPMSCLKLILVPVHPCPFLSHMEQWQLVGSCHFYVLVPPPEENRCHCHLAALLLLWPHSLSQLVWGLLPGHGEMGLSRLLFSVRGTLFPRPAPPQVQTEPGFSAFLCSLAQSPQERAATGTLPVLLASRSDQLLSLRAFGGPCQVQTY